MECAAARGMASHDSGLRFGSKSGALQVAELLG
jgi:hypothetical protein